VELEPVRDPVLVLETVASDLGVHRNPHRSLTVSLIDHLHEKIYCWFSTAVVTSVVRVLNLPKQFCVPAQMCASWQAVIRPSILPLKNAIP
jgi:hypothetical protein